MQRLFGSICNTTQMPRNTSTGRATLAGASTGRAPTPSGISTLALGQAALGLETLPGAERVRLGAVEPAAHSEIHRVEKEKDNHVLVTAFMVAIRQGRVRGQPGSLKVEEINADKIVECFDLGKKLGIRSEHARKLNEEATRLRQLRIQCKESSWAQLSTEARNQLITPRPEGPDTE